MPDPSMITPFTGQAYRMNGPSGATSQWTNGVRNTSNNQPSTFLDQFAAGLQSDITNQQLAASEQHNRLNQQIGQFSSFLQGIPGQVQGATQAGVGALSPLVGQLNNLGDEAVANQGRYSAAITGDLQGARGALGDAVSVADQSAAAASGYAAAGIDTAREYGNSAIATAREAAGRVDAQRAAVIASTTSGLERRAVNDLRMMDTGMRADGTLMTPAELDAFRREKQFDMGQQIGNVVTQINASYDEMRLNADQALAATQLHAGEDISGAQSRAAAVELEGGQLRVGARQAQAAGLTDISRVELALSEQGLEAEKIRQGYRQLSASVQGQIASLLQAGPLTAIDFMMRGQTAMYDMIKQNPRQVVSIASAMAQLATVATSPYGRYLKPIAGANFTVPRTT